MADFGAADSGLETVEPTLTIGLAPVLVEPGRGVPTVCFGVPVNRAPA